jgi:hypothetical protein
MQNPKIKMNHDANYMRIALNRSWNKCKVAPAVKHMSIRVNGGRSPQIIKLSTAESDQFYAPFALYLRRRT